jgi:hypothetical protein
MGPGPADETKRDTSDEFRYDMIMSIRDALNFQKYPIMQKAYDGDIQMIGSSSIRVHQHAANPPLATAPSWDKDSERVVFSFLLDAVQNSRKPTRKRCARAWHCKREATEPLLRFSIRKSAHEEPENKSDDADREYGGHGIISLICE